MIQIKRYSGPAKLHEVVVRVLQSLGVPSHSASVTQSTHDTGYPGLITQSTIVELNLDEDLLKRTEENLKNLGFSEI